MRFFNSIYLAGGMTDITYEESNKWRRMIEDSLADGFHIVNPNSFHNPSLCGELTEKEEREVRNFDLNLLKKCDLVIANFNVPESIGTAQELAIAYEHNIPVIGLNEDNISIHSWLRECCEVIFTDINELIEYVTNYYYL